MQNFILKPKPHEIYRQNKSILENLYSNKYYKKFFIIRSTEGINLAEINVIKANKQLEAVLAGKPKKATKIRDGTLLIEVANERQS